MSDDPGAGRPQGLVARYRVLAGLGFPAAYPLVQFPNAPLWVAIAASVVGRFVDGTAQDYVTATGTAGMVVWAWLELTDGVNLFRGVLGAVVLANSIVGLAQRFG